MESKIVELRERSERQMQRAKRTAVIVAGAGAALGVAALGAFVIYRLTRPTTPGERVGRLLPRGVTRLPRSLRHARLAAGKRLRDGMPPVRLYIGDRQLGEERATTRWEKIAVRAAQAAGTAAAGAIASRVMAGLTDALRNRGETGGRTS
ncbi:MAG: hypothetical protein E6J41_19760 [Chloroflexi bacterium]|nr:MAG: hypothetical protein E6J41_19760 [Chloroflexota bacterium]